MSDYFDELEARRLMSVTLNRHNVITVADTRRSDTITVSLKAGDSSKLIVTESNRQGTVVHEFAAADVNRMNIAGGQGDDLFRVDQTNGVINMPLAIFGGSGRNTLIGGNGPDNITCVDGDNLIYGMGGGDRILAGSGNDRIYGGDGADFIRAGAGNDTVLGESGGDDIQGNDGDDVIFGGTGGDIIAGNGGRDILSGGSGNNTVLSNPLNDITDGDTTDNDPTPFL